MSIFNILVGILFMLFSVSAEASTFEKDIINLPMSSQVYEIKVCKDVETTFFLLQELYCYCQFIQSMEAGNEFQLYIIL